MSKTATDLALRVLGRLFSDSDAGSLPPADLAMVKSFYHGQLAEMNVMNLAYWDEDDIPDEAFEALVDYVAGGVAADFGIALPTITIGNEPIPSLKASGQSRLQRLASRGGTGRRVTAEFF